MDEETKEKLKHHINAAIRIESDAASHFDKYDKEGRKLYDSRKQIQKELFDFIDKL